MPNPMITIHNLETGEIVEREMNENELKTFNKEIAQLKLEQTKIEMDIQAKANLLAKLNITEAEAKLLLS